MNHSDPSAHSRPPATGGRALRVVAILVAALVTALVLASLADAGGWFGGRGHDHDFRAERAHDHAEFAVEWALRHLDASDEQQARIQQIVSSAIDELTALREPHEQHREAFVALLGEEQIDRTRLEALRAQELALAGDASSVLTTALAEIAETLTLEQRKELLEHASKHRRGHGWH